MLQARSLFTASAARDIWKVLKGPLKLTITPSALRSVVLLLTFFPHKTAATNPELPWHSIAAEAVEIWLSVKLNSFWDRLWLCFLSRIAKWDTHVRLLFVSGLLSSKNPAHVNSGSMRALVYTCFLSLTHVTSSSVFPKQPARLDHVLGNSAMEYRELLTGRCS